MEWINVQESIPGFDVKVLVTDGDRLEIGRLEEHSGWTGYDFMKLDVTHWMPLPELPKD